MNSSYQINPYPLIQPPQIPAVITMPLDLAKQTIHTINNTTFVKGINAMLLKELKKHSTVLTSFMADSEIKFLISQLAKDFLTFIGAIVQEVGEEATNEFFQIFFQMLLDAGKKMTYGFSNVTIGLLMSLLGEIPVAGGIADVVVTALTSFNDVIGAITPIIRSSIKVIVTGIHLINKTSESIFNNPALNKLNANFSKFNAKVFGGVSFFTFLENMFESMKDTVEDTLGDTTNLLQKSLADVSENTFGELQKQSNSMNESIQNGTNTMLNNTTTTTTPSFKKGGKRNKTKKRRPYKKYKKIHTYRRRNKRNSRK